MTLALTDTDQPIPKIPNASPDAHHPDFKQPIVPRVGAIPIMQVAPLCPASVFPPQSSSQAPPLFHLPLNPLSSSILP